MDLLAQVLSFIRVSGMTETQLGRRALNDPCFVRDLRNGRIPRDGTVQRVEAWLDEQRAAL